MITRNVYFVYENGEAKLKCGEATILLDAEDVDTVSAYQWAIGRHGYATSGAGEKQILLHRLLTEAKKQDYVDHINRNKLDNRKVNLRICTNQQNLFNRAKQANNQSGYKGVCKVKNGLWQAQIYYCGKAIYLGCYSDPLSAAIAYDNAARSLFGEYAFLNVPSATGAEIETKEVSHYFKLNTKQVDSIRFLHKEGMTIQELSVLFQHSYSAISRIVKNKTFRVTKEGAFRE